MKMDACVVYELVMIQTKLAVHLEASFVIDYKQKAGKTDICKY